MRRLLLLLVLATTASAGELPVVELPVGNSSSPFVAVILTGDGGWRAIDRSLAAEMKRRSIPVVGLLSNDYFAEQRGAEEVARDVEKLIERYATRWHKPRVILIGYSRGAEAVPLALTRMSGATRARIAIAAMLGPATDAELMVHHWWEFWKPNPPAVNLLPFVEAVHDVPLMCIHGTQEEESLCRQLTPKQATIVAVDGGHHFGGRYVALARLIYEAAVRR